MAAGAGGLGLLQRLVVLSSVSSVWGGAVGSVAVGASIGASLADSDEWASTALAWRAGGLTSVGGVDNHIFNTEENCILLDADDSDHDDDVDKEKLLEKNAAVEKQVKISLARTVAEHCSSMNTEHNHGLTEGLKSQEGRL